MRPVRFRARSRWKEASEALRNSILGADCRSQRSHKLSQQELLEFQSGVRASGRCSATCADQLLHNLSDLVASGENRHAFGKGATIPFICC